MFQLPGDTEVVGDAPIPAAFIQPPIREGDALSSAAVGGEETLRRKSGLKRPSHESAIGQKWHSWIDLFLKCRLFSGTFFAVSSIF